MGDLKATVHPAQERTAAPFDYLWAVGAATTMAGSAMLLWASAMRSAMRPCAVQPTRFWYVTLYDASFGPAAAWTAWHNAFSTPTAWWLAPISGPADRGDPTATWGSAYAALGLALMRAWMTPPDVTRNAPAFWQPARNLEQWGQPIPEIAPYSAYRTDGGHAAAQITVTQLGLDRGDRPCVDNAARNRPSSRVLH
jgi:hypothetical protein